MALRIERKKDGRAVKSILHRVADIPGGVTVKVSNLGGDALFEGTPLAKGTDGLFEVVKTAQVITAATASGVKYEVAKGHHFKVGDRFGTAACAGQEIKSIDKSDSAKDVITLSKTLGAEVPIGTCAFETDGESTTLAKTPVGIAGQNQDVESGENLFTDIWVIGVVREATAPAMDDAIKDALKNISYV